MPDTGGQQRRPGSTEHLMEYWVHGPGAAKINWGAEGDFTRCVVAIQDAVSRSGQKPLPDHEIKGLCSNLHERATGARPGHAASEQH